MSGPREQAFMLDRLQELANVYLALDDAVARGAAQLRHRGKGEPPIPIRPSVVDLQQEIEASVLRLLSRGRALLGWSLPPVRLARAGEYISCPDCEANSLWIDRQDWFIYCVLPTCRRRWHWGAEVALLGEIAAARALEVAQDLADTLGEEQEAS